MSGVSKRALALALLSVFVAAASIISLLGASDRAVRVDGTDIPIRPSKPPTADDPLPSTQHLKATTRPPRAKPPQSAVAPVDLGPASTPNGDDIPRGVAENEKVDVRKLAGDLCGHAALDKLGLRFTVSASESDPGTLIIEQVGPNPRALTDVQFSARAISTNALITGVVTQRSRAVWSVTFEAPPPRAADDDAWAPVVAEADVLVTWVGAKFIGQKWHLPDRNDSPSFDEKKRKCLALTLTGECDRFGARIFSGHVTLGSKAAETLPCTRGLLERRGFWRRMDPATAAARPLLADAVGLNHFNGSHWEYTTGRSECPFEYLETGAANSCLASSNVTRVLLFGDSMLVELFNALRDIVAPGRPVRQSKFRKLRMMDVATESGDLTIRFARSYTTAQGHSVIASAGVIAEQIFAFNPHVAIGNLAVLHWQQNERSLRDWAANLRSFAAIVRQRMASTSRPPVAMFYLGHTLIQMGRTQGLEPSRTDDFSRAARAVLGRVGFHYLDPYVLSAARRESAFDGEHWACYHEFGGVGHTIAQLFLNALCNGRLEPPLFKSA